MRIGIFNISGVYQAVVYRIKITPEYRVSFIFMIYDILTLIFALTSYVFPDFMRFVHNYAKIPRFHSFFISISGKIPLGILLPLSCRLIKFCFTIFHSKILPHSSYSHRYALHIKIRQRLMPLPHIFSIPLSKP